MLKDSQAQAFGYGVLYRPRDTKSQDHTPQKMLRFSVVLVCQQEWIKGGFPHLGRGRSLIPKAWI